MYRFHTLHSGAILLGSVPIDQYPLDQLREQFSLVPQETALSENQVIEAVKHS